MHFLLKRFKKIKCIVIFILQKYREKSIHKNWLEMICWYTSIIMMLQVSFIISLDKFVALNVCQKNGYIVSFVVMMECRKGLLQSLGQAEFNHFCVLKKSQSKHCFSFVLKYGSVKVFLA